MPIPPRLEKCSIKGAALAFGTKTSTADGLHPRHVAHLSNRLLDILVDLFVLTERVGEWPKSEAIVITALIPKPDGGLRPIALFRTLFRIYSKARAYEVKNWAKARPDHRCNNSAGRWVGDATWRNQVLAATGLMGKHIVVEPGEDNASELAASMVDEAMRDAEEEANKEEGMAEDDQ